MILLALASAWLIGLAAAALGLTPFWPLALLCVLGVCGGLLYVRDRRNGLLAGGCLLVALLGVMTYEAARPPANPGGIALFNDGATVTLRGEITDEPEQRERSQRFTVRIDAVDEGAGWQPTDDSVLVTARPFPRFAYGDKLTMRARLATPPEDVGFDYREYLARQGVVSLTLFPQIERTRTGGGDFIQRGLIDLRRPFDDALARSMPEPESSLARGILLGQRASIPASVTEDFNRAGISHLVAISGWNVTLVAGFAARLLKWPLGRRYAVLVSMLIVLLYAAFVGGGPAVWRAAVMGEVMLGAVLVGRPGSALTAVTFAAAVLTLLNPLAVNDVSFQLSFFATLGLVAAETRSRDTLQRLTPWLPNAITESTAVTFAASIAVAPVIAFHFGRLSLVALLSNLVAVPAFPFVIGAAFVTAVAGVISSDLGRIVGDVAYLPLAYLVWLAGIASSLPGASVSVDSLNLVDGFVAIAALIGGALVLRRLARGEGVETPRPRRLRWTLATASVLGILAVFVWADVLSPRDGRLVVTVLDVGQGDAILIETPDGRRILVDGGPSGSRLLQRLGEELPASERGIDLVVLTHPHDDHVTGLVSLFDRYEVEAVLAGPLAAEGDSYLAWRRELERRDVPVLSAAAGQYAGLGSGLQLEVLGPPPDAVEGSTDVFNDSSVVLRLVYEDVSFLLTGDIEAPAERAALANGGDLRSTVLKVPHHGSDGSSTAGFLSAVDPRVAVISAGDNNSYGHPSPSTLLRLAGIPFVRTDLNGSVRFSTDGHHLWLDLDHGEVRTVPLDALTR